VRLHLRSPMVLLEGMLSCLKTFSKHLLITL
jgi:hypothetical protein